MTSFRASMLLGLVALTGCQTVPAVEDKNQQPPARPLAPTVITPGYVNRNNAHQISRALNDEIEQDLRTPAGFAAVPAAPTPTK